MQVHTVGAWIHTVIALTHTMCGRTVGTVVTQPQAHPRQPAIYVSAGGDGKCVCLMCPELTVSDRSTSTINTK